MSATVSFVRRQRFLFLSRGSTVSLTSREISSASLFPTSSTEESDSDESAVCMLIEFTSIQLSWHEVVYVGKTAFVVKIWGFRHEIPYLSIIFPFTRILGKELDIFVACIKNIKGGEEPRFRLSPLYYYYQQSWSIMGHYFSFCILFFVSGGRFFTLFL